MLWSDKNVMSKANLPNFGDQCAEQRHFPVSKLRFQGGKRLAWNLRYIDSSLSFFN